MKVDDISAGRELDALVAEKVMDWIVESYECWDTKDGLRTWGLTSFGSFQPSTDIKAAFEVVNWIEADNRIFSMTGPEYLDKSGKLVKGYKVLFFDSRSERPSVRAVADTLPLAICHAALKAVGITEVPE